MSDGIRVSEALGELAVFEAAAFRFGHMVRAFLADLPAGLPGPACVSPKFIDGYDAGHELVVGADSYLHLVFAGEGALDAVDAWAARLGLCVERSGDSRVFGAKAVGAVGGLQVVLGCMVVGRQAAAAAEQHAGGAL